MIVGSDSAETREGPETVRISGPLIRAFLKRAKFSLAPARALDKRAFDFLQLRW